VIIQGSLLDRIDFNIDESLVQVKKGDQTLTRVNFYPFLGLRKATHQQMCLPDDNNHGFGDCHFRNYSAS
jgi:hypothetical protein